MKRKLYDSLVPSFKRIACKLLSQPYQVADIGSRNKGGIRILNPDA